MLFHSFNNNFLLLTATSKLKIIYYYVLGLSKIFKEQMLVRLTKCKCFLTCTKVTLKTTKT